MATSQKPPLRHLTARLAAEFGVIVIGVWIALWADGWASDRRDRATEATRLRALAENIEQTQVALREELDNVRSTETAIRELVSRTFSNPEVAREALLLGFFYVPTFSPELNVYEDLKNSGELSLLTDPTLRQGLSAMDARLEGVLLTAEDLATVQQLNLDRYLLTRVDLLPILGRYLDVPGSDDDLGSIDSFLGSVEFRNLALFKLDLIIQAQEALDLADAELARVLALIEGQL